MDRAASGTTAKIVLKTGCTIHADAPDWAFYHGALASPEICANGTLTFCETKTLGVGNRKTQGQINSV
jgi:hypothetical protein